MASMVALIGRVTNTEKSPRESNKALRKYSSIIGPKIKPSNKGAGSHLNFEKM